VILQSWNGLFSLSLGVENLLVQSILDENECKFIIFHDESVLYCASLIFHESKNYLIIISVRMSDIRNWNAQFSLYLGMEILLVQSDFDEHDCMLIIFHDESIL